MRYKLSTLLLWTALFALAIGWSADRFVNRVPSYEQRLDQHARLSSIITDTHRLHQFYDFPEAYSNRKTDVLFTHFLNLYRDRGLFERVGSKN